MEFAITRNINGQDVSFQLTDDEIEKLIDALDEEEAKREYDFEVVFELKDDLTSEERELAEAQIKKCMNRHDIVQIREKTYANRYGKKDSDDFGKTAFFYFDLEDIKQYFKKLELFDFWTGGHEVAV
ncbi:MAG: hypothetical protein ACTTH0_03690 [Eubacteriales bacterium]